MSTLSRMCKSRNNWKNTAVFRGNENRYFAEKTLALKKSATLKKRAKRRQRSAKGYRKQSKYTCIRCKVDLVFIALQLLSLYRGPATT